MKESGEPDQLLDRLRQGEEGALADAFEQYWHRLWWTVDVRMDSRLHARVDVDDVLQEAYIQAAQRVQHYLKDPSRSLFVWLRLIACQTLTDVRRRHLGTQMRNAARDVGIYDGCDPQCTSAFLAGILSGGLTSPSRAAVRAEVSQQLEEALQSMDPIDREVLVMRHFEDMANGEIAEALGVQPSTASMRYARALRRLKNILLQIPDLLDSSQSAS